MATIGPLIRAADLLRELRPTLTLAFPIILGQVGQMLIGITDSIMIGRVGAVPLAASAFAHSVFIMMFIAAWGMLLSVSVLIARSHGAEQPRESCEYLRHGMAMAVGLGLASWILLEVISTQFHRFGQPPEVVAEVGPYFRLIAASLLPALIFQVLRQYGESLGHPWAPMNILLGGVALNVLLNWILIYGNWGAPAMGLEGAGWASLIARIATAAFAWWWLARSADLHSTWPGRGDGNPRWGNRLSWTRMREILAIGIPASAQWIFEAGAFNMAAIMMGWLGTIPLAAHQIAISCAAFTFMVPLGLSSAVSIRIGQAIGARKMAAARSIGFGGVAAGLVIMAGTALVYAIGGGWMAAGFTTDPEVIAMAARLLVIAGLFQLFDGTQVLASGALRGMADVKIPTLLAFVAYWLVALPLGGWLAFRAAAGPVGIWTGLAAGLACAAVLFVWRFNQLTRVR